MAIGSTLSCLNNTLRVQLIHAQALTKVTLCASALIETFFCAGTF
jgi:hypothetical protein